MFVDRGGKQIPGGITKFVNVGLRSTVSITHQEDDESTLTLCNKLNTNTYPFVSS